jgi:hypothetical protein
MERGMGEQIGIDINMVNTLSVLTGATELIGWV